MGKSDTVRRPEDLQHRRDGWVEVGSGHGCCVVPGPGSTEESASELAREAVRAGKKVLWITGQATNADSITLEALLGPEHLDCIETGQAQLVELAGGRPSSSELDSATVLARIRSAALESLHGSRRAGVRVLVPTTEMRSLLPDPRQLRELEEGLSSLARECPVEIVCLVPETEEEPLSLIRALDSHPHLVPLVRLVPNPWLHSSPDQDWESRSGNLAARMDLLTRLAETEDRERWRQALSGLRKSLGVAYDATDPKEALAHFLRETCQAVGWPVGRVFLPNEDRSRLLASDIEHPDDARRETLLASLRESSVATIPEAVGRAWSGGRACWAPFAPESDLSPGSQPARVRIVRGQLALPIVAGGELFAVLWFLSRTSRLPDAGLLTTLEMAGMRLGEVFRRQQVEARLSRSERRMKAVIRTADHGIIIADSEERVLSWNPAAEKLFGGTGEHIRGASLTSLFAPRTRRYLSMAIREVLGSPRSNAAATTLNGHGVGRDGREIPLEVTVGRWDSGERSYVTVSVSDLTEKMLLEDALQRSDRDPLTGLPNRELLLRRLGSSMARGHERPNYRYALLLLNLDGFDQLEASLGPVAGDRFLVGVAQRLEASVRPGDTIARLARDEFAVLLEYVDKVQDVILVTERVLRGMDQPFRVGEQEIRTSATVGIALSDSGYTDPVTMLAEADAAMARARHIRRPYEIADTESYKDTLALFRMEADLRASLQREEFIIHYQPLVSVDSGRIVGFEALARWNHPERGLVGPDQFIPVLEASGMIGNLGRWVRRESSAQIANWQKSYPSSPALMLSVNVSPVELEDPDFVDGVREVLASTGLDASSLHLEITETVFMKRPDRVLEVLAELKALGVQAWIDDFGTGYSSLGYLHHFPVGLLKIDRLFVGRIDQTQLNKSIVRTILDLAANLGIGALAEGVETPDQLAQLRQLSCRYAQGYLFSKPVENAAAERLLAGQEAQPMRVKGWG